MRKRLGDMLIEHGWARDKREAFIAVTEGRVFVNGQKAVSPGQPAADDDQIEMRAGREYVGRGAYKLEAALTEFGVDVREHVCADLGSATGGFVEVLLRHGAEKVYAIDVGRGKLDQTLRSDPRVIVREGTNALAINCLSEPINLITIDLSFTSLKRILPKVRLWLAEKGRVIALFKPQYEITDKSLLSHGIVRDAAARQSLLDAFAAWLRTHGWRELGRIESPIRGSEGNIEYLFYLTPHRTP